MLDKHEKKMQRKTVARHTKYIEGNAAENFMRQIAEEGQKMEQESKAAVAPSRPTYGGAGAATASSPAPAAEVCFNFFGVGLISF